VHSIEIERERERQADIALAIEMLKELRSGNALAELAREMRKVIGAVRESHRPGALTLTIKLKPLKGHGALDISDMVTTKTPSPERESSILFATEDNRLSRNDPRQPELDGLRRAAAPGPVPLRRPEPQQEETGS
jgi:hypothetical protein